MATSKKLDSIKSRPACQLKQINVKRKRASYSTGKIFFLVRCLFWHMSSACYI